ncbi:MAG TPA: hypothetical protein DIC35_01015 [Candidatus Moranbacteria bacterium]|nr:hypothetical protein [Candidatus Moranbacteria bacterium]
MVGMYPELESWATEEALSRPKESPKGEMQEATDLEAGGEGSTEDPCDIDDQSTHFIYSR